EPSGYHLFNMLVHLSCAVALFATVRRAMLRWNSSGVDNAEATGIAFASALLWMLHPLQTECVNYVSQRTESMAALCILASLYCAIRSYETRHRSGWIVAAGAAGWAGAFCKEIAAVGPVLVVLMDLTFSQRSLREAVRQRWRLYAATFSSWIPLAGLLYLLPRTVTVGATGDATVIQYALNQSLLVMQYLRLVVWPDVLVIDYGRPRDVSWFEAFPAVVAVLSLLAMTLALYRRYPAVSYLGLAGFLLLAPTSSLLPINSEVGAERRMYLPLAAVAVMVVLGVREIVRRCCEWLNRRKTPIAIEPNVRYERRSGQAVICGVLLASSAVVLGVRTIERNNDYAAPLKLWTQAVEAYPDNPRAWTWLAFELSRVDRVKSERVTAVMASRWRDDWSVLFGVAEAYLCLHRNAAEAGRCYRRVIEIAPSHVRARLRLVWLLAGCGDGDLRNGDEALRIATALQAEYPYSAEILDALAIAQAECGEFAAAIATAESAIAHAEAAGNSTTMLRERIERYRTSRPFRFHEI
ncbi:MAG: hypothetical protein WD070_00170, partial [Pirellulaceae bacterium]